MIRLIFFIPAIFVIASCNRSTSLSETDKKSVAEEVHKTLNNYYSDIKKDGLLAEFKWLDSSDHFFWVPPGYSSSIDYDSVATVIKQNAGKYRSVDNSFDDLKIIPLSREFATYTGRLHSVMIDTSGKSFSFSLVETGVLIKRKDGWRLLSGQTTMINQ